MKMEIIGPFILSIVSGLSTMMGVLFIYLKINRVEEYIAFSLSLSMIILLFIGIFELIPDSYINLIHKYYIYYGTIITILVFLLGYQTIYFINKMVKNENNLYKIGIVTLVSLIIHNIPEGIIVFLSSFKSIKIGYRLCIAIIMHNIVEGSLIAIPMYYSTRSRGRVLKYTLTASLSEPLGALLSYLFLKDHITTLTISYISLFVSGLMICLSINDIFKEILKYNHKKYIIYGVVVGILLSIIFLII